MAGGTVSERSNHFISFGEEILRVSLEDDSDYAMARRFPELMLCVKAVDAAPALCSEIDGARSGDALLELIERYLRRIEKDVYATQWPDGLTDYQGLEPARLQVLAQRIAAVSRRRASESAAVSLIAHALLGLAGERELDEPKKEEYCRACYRRAASSRHYCLRHGISREERLDGTKTRGHPANRDVVRRRLPAVKAKWLQLAKNQDAIYARLRRQLIGATGALNPFPPPLEQVGDNDFAFGACIGRNGGDWLLYLWQVLPRVQAILGTDWPELVRVAIEYKEWTRVLDRLRREIDCQLRSTEAFQWANALIDAERWLEASELVLKPRRGRPPKERPSAHIKKALASVAEGDSVTGAAARHGVPRSTLYDWKAKRARRSKGEK